MANKKITALTAITALDVADVLPVADVSIPETKKITAANLWLGGFNAHKDTDGTFAANSDLVFPTQKATKTYVGTRYLPLAGGTMSGSLGIDHIEEATSAHGVAIDGLTIKDGTIVLSGGQIAFPATAIPSAGANTLDDYEEGGWTPALKFGGNAVGMAYGTQSGSYTKIGRLLHLFAVIVLTAKGTSTGPATITGLPFSINSNAEPATIFVNTITFGGTMEGDAQGTAVGLYDVSEAGGLGYITNADFADTSSLRISITTFV